LNRIKLPTFRDQNSRCGPLSRGACP
jgi:hypothetical protein